MRAILPNHLLFTAALSVAALFTITPVSAASVDGATIHSTVHGKGPNTLIFVHGWTCDETSWDAQVPVFDKNYRVITIDLPGHGQSGSPTKGTLTMELFARAIEAVRAEAKAGKVVLIGHSMGTPVIRQYAYMYPANVAGMVVVDGNLHMAGGGTPAVLDRLKGPDGPKNREGMIRGMFGPSATPAMQEHVVKMMLRPPESTATQAMMSMYEPVKWIDKTVTVPALGIFADHSGADDPAYFKKIFPNGTSSQVAGTGHFVMMEKPDEFNKLLAVFLPKAKF